MGDNMRKNNLIAVAGVAGLLVALTAGAEAKTGGFCGPVVKLTEATCIGVKSTLPGGPMYEITSANPKPDVGAMIMGSGTISGGVTTCMEGTHLTDVKWKKVTVCPLAK
jgi:hypothetical protein